ncbi:PIN domain-like protein [Suillus decipiens]|nr:PIN domain-like protein [Suillus decipiens]
MGISGLLPLLKSIQLHRHLSDFAGQTLAVDAYVWLHRGVYACATEIATGKPSTKYVDYAMQRVRLLRHHKIRPYIVFDGGPLPAKMGTETERKQRREENLAKAKTLASQGRHKEAREYFVKCIDVTPQMAYQLIKALRAENVSYVVAPYEADAQMAYLERVGLVDGIITEDSDLLVFGCRKVLFKLDSIASSVVSISKDDFGSVTAAEGGISLLGWSDAQFRAMAILSGCDYLPSIPGIGLKTAWSLLRKYKSVEQVVRAIRLEGKKSVPKGYLEAYNLAEKVFLHQRVYCPLDERLVNLTDIPPGVEWGDKEESYIGGLVSEQSLDGDPSTHLFP